MITPTYDQLIQLEAKLGNEVNRLHPNTNARLGTVELTVDEATVLLQLVQQAKAAE